MKIITKIICSLAVFAMIFSVFTGCKKESTSQNTTDKSGVKTYKLTFVTHGVSLPTSKPKYYDEVAKAINERLVKDLGFKVDITVKSYPDDVAAEKINLDIASNVPYDLVRMSDTDALAGYYNQEMANDITKYINKSENLKKNLSADLFKEVTIDSKIYAIPIPAYPIYAASWARKDMFDEFGLKIPETMPELELALKTLKEKKLNGDGQIVWAITLAELEPFLLGNFTATPGNFISSTGKMKPKYYDPGYKAFITKVAEWYKTKYVDEFLFSGTNNTSADLLNKGKAAISGTNIWMLEYGTLNAINKAKPQYKITFMSQLKDTKKHMSNGRATEYLWSPVTSKNAEIAIKFIDWSMFNEENYDLVMNGIEGKTYEKVGDARAVPKSELNDKIKTITDLMGIFSVGANSKLNIKYLNPTLQPEARKAYNQYINTDLNTLYIQPSKYAITRLPDDIGNKLNDASSKLVDSISKMIRGEKPISDWDAMLAEFEKMGGLKAFDIYTDIYNKNK